MIIWLIGYLFAVGVKGALESDKKENIWEMIRFFLWWPTYLGLLIGLFLEKLEDKE